MHSNNSEKKRYRCKQNDQWATEKERERDTENVTNFQYIFQFRTISLPLSISLFFEHCIFLSSVFSVLSSVQATIELLYIAYVFACEKR